MPAPPLASAAQAALDQHPTIRVHADAVEALTDAVAKLAADLPESKLPTQSDLLEALDGLEALLNSRRRDPLRSLGGFLGSANRSDAVRDDSAQAWLELATGSVAAPVSIASETLPEPTVEFVRDLDPARSTEAQVGRLMFQVHHLARTLEVVIDLLDEDNRERANRLADARQAIRNVERSLPDFGATA
ncbi:MAG: hypothetical protein ACYTFV_18115 [Planctomycetota bacterium]|jgi:hypothetical protein